MYLTDHLVLGILLERQLTTASFRSDYHPWPLSMKSAHLKQACSGLGPDVACLLTLTLGRGILSAR